MLIFTHFEWKSWPYLAVLAKLQKVDCMLLFLKALQSKHPHAHFYSFWMKKLTVSCCFGCTLHFSSFDAQSQQHVRDPSSRSVWNVWPWNSLVNFQMKKLTASCCVWMPCEQAFLMHILTQFGWKSGPCLAVLDVLSTFESFRMKKLANWPCLAVLDVSCTFWIVSNEKIGRILLFWTSHAHFESCGS